MTILPFISLTLPRRSSLVELGPASINRTGPNRMPPNKRNVEGCCTAGTFWKLKLRASMASAAAKTPTRSEVLSLFRCLLRTGRDFCDYNVREYTKRRTIDAFRSNRSLSDQQSVSAAYADGKEQLAIAKRQAIVYSLYSPKVKSIMELNQV